MERLIAFVLFATALASNVRAADLRLPPATATQSITTNDLLRHTTKLASDEFEGRAPASRGEELTVEYLTQEFKKLGLQGGNPNGGFTQEVPMVGITTTPTISFQTAKGPLELAHPTEVTLGTRRFLPETSVTDSELVFVGYGVQAPEFQWDDYKGVDLKGKTLVMLINDPAIPDPNDPSKLDERMFKGKAMTYYGRWTYKYEIAVEKGAAACLIIHETGPAGYPYFVVMSSWSRENFEIARDDKNAGWLAAEGWLSLDAAKKLLASTGHDFDKLKQQALTRDFKPVPLGIKANIKTQSKIREIKSRNVIARLEGSDPEARHEHIVITAHWDHLGKNPKLEGDQIFNGALDNATGTSALVEIAEAFTKLAHKPRRSVLFLALTAEESGLLGAKYYATNPLHPIENCIANINMDGMNQWGLTRDVSIVGMGQSTLEELLAEHARNQGRVVSPDAFPEKGFYFRSDHFEFAKVGVPALYMDNGTDFIGKSKEFAQQKLDEYTSKDYHTVSDEVKPDWDLSGAVQDAQLLFSVAHHLAASSEYPEWKPTSEFRSKRPEARPKKR